MKWCFMIGGCLIWCTHRLFTFGLLSRSSRRCVCKFRLRGRFYTGVGSRASFFFKKPTLDMAISRRVLSSTHLLHSFTRMGKLTPDGT